MVSISFKITLPQGRFATKKWVDEIARVQRQTSVPRLRKLFQQTTFGWSKKPDFGWAQKRTKDEVSISMYATGQHADIWNLVNEGSPPHTISAKKSGWLRFRPGYRSATTPGSLQSRRAYRSGKFTEPWSVTRVNHPGFEARKFTEMIAEQYENPYLDEMQDAIDKIAKT